MKIVFLLLLIIFSGSIFAQKCQHSSEVKALFKQLEVSGFDTKQKINYQYFFLDESQQDLVKFRETLTEKGFRFVGFSKSGNKNQLQVEKIEAHNAESMLEKGKELSQLAKLNNIETFDGFEINNAEESTDNQNFSKEIEKIPSNLLFKKGLEFYENEENDKALVVFDRCIKLKINTETSLYKRGNCKTSLGNFEGAIKDFEEVLKINPNNFEANFNLAGLLFETKNYEKSIEVYKKVTILNPRSDDAFYRLAESFLKLGDKNSAIQNCQKSLQINPNNEFSKELMRKLK